LSLNETSLSAPLLILSVCLTFKELRTETKLKVLEKSIELDYKIDQKFPNYKDNIKDKYHDLKEKAVSTYLNMILFSKTFNFVSVLNSLKVIPFIVDPLNIKL